MQRGRKTKRDRDSRETLRLQTEMVSTQSGVSPNGGTNLIRRRKFEFKLVQERDRERWGVWSM